MTNTGILPARIAQLASTDPDRTYLEHVDGRTLTYGELHADALRWSAALRRCDVGPGDTVAIMLPVDFDAVEGWLGIDWLGAVEVPVNTAYIGAMLAYVVDNSGAETMVVHARFLDRLAQVRDQLPRLRHVVVVGSTEAAVRVAGETWPEGGVAATELLQAVEPASGLPTPGPDAIASILYTSGTTGPSKGVLVPWAQLLATADGTFPDDALDQRDAFYAPLPLFHVGGKTILQLMATCGGRVVLREQFDTGAFWSDIARHRCTTTLLLGAMANFLARQDERPDDAATPLDKVLMVPVIKDVQSFVKRFGVQVCTVFNMTETSSPITSNGWIDGDDESCGTVRPGYQVRLVDEHDREVPVGQLGELVIRADEPWTQMAGYHDMPEKTVEAWRNQWLHTGDGFIRDGEGRFHFVDRQKDAIRRRGENISSFEVEAAVNTHPAVLESAAVAVPSEFSEDEVLVTVVLRPGQRTEARELHAYLAQRMPRFMVPRYLRFVDALPKTPTEKVRKAELRRTGIDETTWDAGDSRRGAKQQAQATAV